MKYNEQLIEFKNGLRLVFLNSPGFFTSKIKIKFLVGGEDEDLPRGIAHLLEHSLFKGTSKYSQEKLSEEFIKVSASPDASTSAEFTSFNATFPKASIERVFELLSDMIFDSSFNHEQIEREKEVIIQESLMLKDSHENLVFDNLLEEMYKGSGLANLLTGEIELLKKVTANDIRSFRDKYYRPENCLILVGGDFDVNYIVSLIDKYFTNNFSKINSKEIGKKHWTPKININSTIRVEKKELMQSSIILGYRSPDALDTDRLKFMIMNSILGGSMNSRLFVKLRNEMSLCYNIYSNTILYKNNGLMLVELSTENEKAPLAIKTIKEEIQKMCDKGVADEEFNIMKNIIVNSYKMKQDAPYFNSEHIAYTGELFNREEAISFIEKLTKQECEDVFRKYLSKVNPFISIVGDVDKASILKINNN